jgi:hypothetical protein
MDTSAEAALKNAILKSPPFVRAAPGRFQEQHLVWRRKGNAWQGEFQLKPDIGRALASAQKDLEKFGSEFSDVFFTAHPEYAGLFGFPGLGGQNLGHDKAFFLGSMLGIMISGQSLLSTQSESVNRNCPTADPKSRRVVKS